MTLIFFLLFYKVIQIYKIDWLFYFFVNKKIKNFNLNNPKAIIIQVLDLTTNISTGAVLTDFTANSVRIDTNTVNNCDIKLSI